MAREFRRVASLVVAMAFAAALDAQVPPAEDLRNLTLVKSSDAHAVVRFGKGPLRLIARGDRLGRRGAEVVEIAAGRVVIEESFPGSDGEPNRAQIVLKNGETGGRRFLMRLEDPAPPALRPKVVVPPGR